MTEKTIKLTIDSCEGKINYTRLVLDGLEVVRTDKIRVSALEQVFSNVLERAIKEETNKTTLPKEYFRENGELFVKVPAYESDKVCSGCYFDDFNDCPDKDCANSIFLHVKETK